MIRSMTGFGRARRDFPDKALTVELKSVNSRYLDLFVKAPRLYNPLEAKIKQYLQTHDIRRGKVELSISLEKKESTETVIHLDEALVSGYLSALYTLRDRFGLTDDISVMRLAEFRDIFRSDKPEEDLDAEWNDLLPVMEEAVAAFLLSRENEGEALNKDLLSRLSLVEEYKNRVAALSEEDKTAYRGRLEGRLRQTIGDAGLSFDENRILTECAIFADRVAVDEETVRLDSHFDAFRAILSSKEAAGRKLDFLMQEMNRETNTIGSKCSNAEIAQIVVNMKCELEKIREQVQNIE